MSFCTKSYKDVTKIRHPYRKVIYSHLCEELLNILKYILKIYSKKCIEHNAHVACACLQAIVTLSLKTQLKYLFFDLLFSTKLIILHEYLDKCYKLILLFIW